MKHDISQHKTDRQDERMQQKKEHPLEDISIGFQQ